jgi:hypothetical protein
VVLHRSRIEQVAKLSAVSHFVAAAMSSFSQIVSASNTSRIQYASMSYLDIFYDYCVSGIDFSLPGNGGKDCASYISSGRRAAETALALTSGVSFVWLGYKMHRPPKKIDVGKNDPYRCKKRILHMYKVVV